MVDEPKTNDRGTNQTPQATNKHVLADQNQIKTANEHLLADQNHIKATNEHLLADQNHIKAANEHLLADQHQIKVTNERLLDDQHQIKETNGHLLDDQHQINTTNEHLLDDQHDINATNAHLLDDQRDINATNAHLLDDQHDINATNAHLLAEQQHIRATNEHLLADQHKIKLLNEYLLREQDWLKQANKRLHAKQDITEEVDRLHAEQYITGIANAPEPKGIGAKMKMAPGMFEKVDIEAIAMLAKMVPAGGTIVDIGSLLGASASLWCIFSPAARIVCIDPWKYIPFLEPYRAAFGPITKDAFLANVPDERIEAIEGYSPYCAEKWSDPIDLFWVDADHINPACADGIRFWSSFVKQGGIACGHDYHLGDVKSEADALARRWGSKVQLFGSVWWTRNETSTLASKQAEADNERMSPA
jgi:hypothetical protein